MIQKRYIVKVIFVILLFSIVPIAAQDDNAQTEPVTLQDSEVWHLTSENFTEDFVIWVALPASYSTTETQFPVLYVLDPPVTFGTVVDITRLGAFVEVLPETIVVGIGYRPEDVENIGELRIRDFVIEAEVFLAFVETEVIPVIDANYRTLPDDRGLMGWSAGASFVLSTMFNQPSLFHRYVAISPILQEIDGMSIPRLEREFFATSSTLTAMLFLAVGELEGNAVRLTERFASTLSERGYPDLTLTSAVIDDAGHTNVIAGAVARALAQVYCANRNGCTIARPIG